MKEKYVSPESDNDDSPGSRSEMLTQIFFDNLHKDPGFTIDDIQDHVIQILIAVSLI